MSTGSIKMAASGAWKQVAQWHGGCWSQDPGPAFVTRELGLTAFCCLGARTVIIVTEMDSLDLMRVTSEGLRIVTGRE